jgi:hypothetical protein
MLGSWLLPSNGLPTAGLWEVMAIGSPTVMDGACWFIDGGVFCLPLHTVRVFFRFLNEGLRSHSSWCQLSSRVEGRVPLSQA